MFHSGVQRPNNEKIEFRSMNASGGLWPPEDFMNRLQGHFGGVARSTFQCVIKKAPSSSVRVFCHAPLDTKKNKRRCIDYERFFCQSFFPQFVTPVLTTVFTPVFTPLFTPVFTTFLANWVRIFVQEMLGQMSHKTFEQNVRSIQPPEFV